MTKRPPAASVRLTRAFSTRTSPSSSGSSSEGTFASAAAGAAGAEGMASAAAGGVPAAGPRRATDRSGSVSTISSTTMRPEKRGESATRAWPPAALTVRLLSGPSRFQASLPKSTPSGKRDRRGWSVKVTGAPVALLTASEMVVATNPVSRRVSTKAPAPASSRTIRTNQSRRRFMAISHARLRRGRQDMPSRRRSPGGERFRTRRNVRRTGGGVYRLAAYQSPARRRPRRTSTCGS